VEFQNQEILQIQEKIAKDNGFRLVGHSLVLYVKPVPSKPQ
jgi:Fur family ferric uptake transcriptional regulator